LSGLNKLSLEDLHLSDSRLVGLRSELRRVLVVVHYIHHDLHVFPSYFPTHARYLIKLGHLPSLFEQLPFDLVDTSSFICENLLFFWSEKVPKISDERLLLSGTF
jgi:hypothetical protein